MKSQAIFLIFLLIATTAIAANSSTPPTSNNNITKNAEDNLKKFSSPSEIKLFIEKNSLKSGGRAYKSLGLDSVAMMPMAESMAMEGSVDFSTTNIQVEGVDEADIVKNDGKYIYLLSKNKLYIVDAFPPEKARILSTITSKQHPIKIYVNGDRLVLIGNEMMVPEDIEPMPSITQRTSVTFYDIKNRSRPRVVKEVLVDGTYYDSRMIENHVYVVANQYSLYYEDEIIMPEVTTKREGVRSAINPDVYYFDSPDYSYAFTNIVSIDVADENNEAFAKTYLLGAANTIFVSKNNIYITYPKMVFQPVLYEKVLEEVSKSLIPVLEKEWTIVHRIAIKNGLVRHEASGEFPGRLLNQFSMDEYKEFFRAATTTGHVSRRGSETSANHIYIMNRDLKIVGAVEDLAPGERIYSARFMGERAYLVTFQKVDPLFVIDLSNPEAPLVLGKLKIPGYSDYLHPYDENHVIGIGKDTIEAEEGNFAWYQGVKLALFDVSDVENPKERSKVIIGDRGTESEALHDHKALLFSREKNLLVIPILLAEIDGERYVGEPRANAYGEYVWQGAYVFRLDLEKGFRLKGRITHYEDSVSFLKSGRFYYGSDRSIRRSLYIDDVLYTISESLIKMNGLEELEEVNSLQIKG